MEKIRKNNFPNILRWNTINQLCHLLTRYHVPFNPQITGVTILTLRLWGKQQQRTKISRFGMSICACLIPQCIFLASMYTPSHSNGPQCPTVIPSGYKITYSGPFLGYQFSPTDQSVDYSLDNSDTSINNKEFF